MMQSHLDNQTTPTFKLPLIDTHTHFDDDVFDSDRLELAKLAYVAGVKHIVLIGYVAKYFQRLYDVFNCFNHNNQYDTDNEIANNKLNPHDSDITQCASNNKDSINNDRLATLGVPKLHLASGLHPTYIKQHTKADLDTLAQCLKTYPHIAIGEIGLDTYSDDLKAEAVISKQIEFFKAQLDLAVVHQLPVLLHIRKAHAECLAILKAHRYDARKLGGIAHSFSGGEQEAKAFVKLGFKLGVTGQVTNPNAKKLRKALGAVVDAHGLSCLVIETDCPDMTPLACQHYNTNEGQTHTRNVPANLVYVIQSLSELLKVEPTTLAKQLWHNSCDALKVKWSYPVSN